MSDVLPLGLGDKVVIVTGGGADIGAGIAIMTRAEEVAATVVFLLSDWAGHITGQSIVVDGDYRHLGRARTRG